MSESVKIIFRTANGSQLAAATRNAVVAVQLDEFDMTTHSRWSVLGVGEGASVRSARLTRGLLPGGRDAGASRKG